MSLSPHTHPLMIPRLAVLLAMLSIAPVSAATHPVMESARRKITAFHAGEKPSGAFVRVVYFHAADRQPLADHKARLDRCLTDVSAFYRDGMERRFGVPDAGVPFERKDGKLVVHTVRGSLPSDRYDYQSGDQTWKEIRAALAKTIDPEREHVLVLYGLCDQEPDGRFVFHSPYYGAGWSDQARGLCHAADCPLLDPVLLTEKNRPFVFKEHNYERMEMSVAKFNSWYLGGLAHELGHGLGFPHDNGGPGEDPGVSLMGGGNLHYREDLWGGSKPAYLSLATALRLAAHPLVTRSNKERWRPAEITFGRLAATATGKSLRLTGKVSATAPPCAVIASVWPTTAKTDHGAMTFCSAVDDQGGFTLDLTNLKAPSWNLKLTALLVNGAESGQVHTFRCDAGGTPAAAELGTRLTLLSAEQTLMRDPDAAAKLLTDAAIAAAPTEEARKGLRILRRMADPAPQPVDLTTSTARSLYLSDAAWTKASVGWGKTARNRYWFNRGQWEGMLLMIDGKVYPKGLYAHADSSYVFPLNGGWRTFTATVGLRDGADSQGSAVFTVSGDGRELHRTPIIRPGGSKEIRLDVAGVKSLELRATGGEGHNRNAWSIWVDPKIER